MLPNFELTVEYPSSKKASSLPSYPAKDFSKRVSHSPSASSREEEEALPRESLSVVPSEEELPSREEEEAGTSTSISEEEEREEARGEEQEASKARASGNKHFLVMAKLYTKRRDVRGFLRVAALTFWLPPRMQCHPRRVNC